MKMTFILTIYSNLIQFTEAAIFATLNLKIQEVKKTMFLFHYGQMGGNRGNGQLPVNILKRGSITYYTITYEHHKNFDDFFGD